MPASITTTLSLSSGRAKVWWWWPRLANVGAVCSLSLSLGDFVGVGCGSTSQCACGLQSGFLVRRNRLPAYSTRNERKIPAIAIEPVVASYFSVPRHGLPNMSCAWVNNWRKNGLSAYILIYT